MYLLEVYTDYYTIFKMINNSTSVGIETSGLIKYGDIKLD